MAIQIKFGTDGWRGVIADDFTFENVHKVALATLKHYKKHKKIKNGIVIGYDARFLSREFAQAVATVLGNNNVRSIISKEVSSTPMVSLLTREYNAAAGIVITASHNPAKYNGYKIKGEFGGPAFPETIAKVEKELKTTIKAKIVLKKSYADLVAKGVVKEIDFTTPYVEDLKKKLDLDLIASAGIKIAFDAMHGAGMGVLSRIVPIKASLREVYNPSFGGAHPEPLERHLKDLGPAVVANGCDIGIATDGDADRVGAFDEKGNFVNSHRIFALVLKYLVEEKKWKGEVARSFTVSEIITKMCAAYGMPLHTTPVGFKYLCELMMNRDVICAAEESGGIGVRGHIPERDGVYVGLLLAEMIAKKKMPLSAIVEEMMGQFGWVYYDRIDRHLTEKEKQRIIKYYAKHPKSVGKYPVTSVSTIDGVKLFVENGWLLVRASGTEPLVRFYVEADTPEKVQEMLKAAVSV